MPRESVSRSSCPYSNFPFPTSHKDLMALGGTTGRHGIAALATNGIDIALPYRMAEDRSPQWLNSFCVLATP